jgi:hypothetical protein
MVAGAAASVVAFDGGWGEAGRHDGGGDVLFGSIFRHYVVQKSRRS